MSLLSKLGVKNVSGLLFFLNPVDMKSKFTARWIKSYPSLDSTAWSQIILLIKQVCLSIGFETR